MKQKKKGIWLGKKEGKKEGIELALELINKGYTEDQIRNYIAQSNN
ncbi:MAG: hypothetical protein LBS29_05110 [Endomicrobium sp.]|jgi:hypothetical protein|nr:hypothetical protein [Endomicrobium sp.]